MANGVFIERNGYFVVCDAVQLQNGKWGATAMFERKWDHDHNALVPGMRHNIKAQFDSKNDAIQAALAVAHQRADADDTGL